MLVQLLQTMWEHRKIPPQMTWVINVLIPKGGGYFRGIGLLKPAWKTAENIMDKRLQAIDLHDCRHAASKLGEGQAQPLSRPSLYSSLRTLSKTPCMASSSTCARPMTQ